MEMLLPAAPCFHSQMSMPHAVVPGSNVLPLHLCYPLRLPANYRTHIFIKNIPKNYQKIFIAGVPACAALALEWFSKMILLAIRCQGLIFISYISNFSLIAISAQYCPVQCFCLPTADFTRAYIVDSLGNSKYDLKSQRGTVLKVTPGSDKREISCTGTRFPCSMAFNSEGDLFAVDQEGATWLPNGNPYDELLHIEEGRHYGFPPRHPKHLSNVIDEPSVYDYKPQHQSTTGLNFNLPVNNGPVFGPSWWEGDAIVSGYSRGKIYRTSLVKTSAGYVAQNSIFASLTVLTVLPFHPKANL